MNTKQSHLKAALNEDFFHLLVVGATGRGKSYAVYKNLLMNDDYLKYKFNRVYVFIPTYECNKHYIDPLHLQDELDKKRRNQIEVNIYKGMYDKYIIPKYKEWLKGEEMRVSDIDLYLKYRKLTLKQKDVIIDDLNKITPYNDEDEEKDVRIFRSFNSEKVEELFEQKLLYQEEKWLLIFDDCSYDKDFVLDKNYKMLLRNGRSRGLSTITLAQKLVDIPTKVRSQMTAIMNFYNAQEIEIQALYRTGGTIHGFDGFYQQLQDEYSRRKEHTFLFCNLSETNPQKSLYWNDEEQPYIMNGKVRYNKQRNVCFDESIF
jgi:hypothetical protein